MSFNHPATQHHCSEHPVCLVPGNGVEKGAGGWRGWPGGAIIVDLQHAAVDAVDGKLLLGVGRALFGLGGHSGGELVLCRCWAREQVRNKPGYWSSVGHHRSGVSISTDTCVHKESQTHSPQIPVHAQAHAHDREVSTLTCSQMPSPRALSYLCDGGQTCSQMHTLIFARSAPVVMSVDASLRTYSQIHISGWSEHAILLVCSRHPSTWLHVCVPCPLHTVPLIVPAT